jgi:hypothetical protein
MSRKYVQLLNNSDFVCFLFLFHKNKFDETMCYIRKLNFINFSPYLSLLCSVFVLVTNEIEWNPISSFLISGTIILVEVN